MSAAYPKDPAILMGWVNMKLRDFYTNLDELCDDLQINRKDIEGDLNKAGFEYDEALNKFW